MRDIRVLVVDDHRVFADAMRLILGRREGLVSIEAVTSAEEALERCREAPPDVVLMDLSLPGMDGLEGTRRLREAHPETSVVVVTAHDEATAAAAALEAGACATVSKTRPPDDLLAAVRKAMQDEHPRASRPVEPREGNGSVELTARETQILEAVAQGRSTRELAASFGISPLTVETHLKSIYGKLDVHSRVEAITAAWRRGLISDTRTA